MRISLQSSGELIRENKLLSPEFSREEIVILNSPVNSSGDVYHIAAYLILCKHFRWRLPLVYFFFDTDEIKIQSERAINFLGLFGFSSRLKNLSLQRNSGGSSHSLRMKLSREAMSKEKNCRYIVDQKMVTALLSQAFLKYGKMNITRALCFGFLSSPWGSIPKIEACILNKWLDNKIEKIAKVLRGEIFVVLNHRVSGHANKKHNISDKGIEIIVQMLKSYNIKTVILIISDKPAPILFNLKSKAMDEDLCIVAFEKIQGLHEKYDKFRHVQLIHAISLLENFFGFIGGTSGTLDIAGLLGINVFNIHNFSSEVTDIADLIDQDFRILLQNSFMTISPQITLPIAQNYFKWWLHYGFQGIPLLIPSKNNGTHRSDSYEHHLCFKNAYRNYGLYKSIKLNPGFTGQVDAMNRNKKLSESFNKRC